MTRFKHYRIYKKHRPLRIVLLAVLCVVLVLVIFWVSAFFGFRKYIVYTTDGLRVEVPWLQEEVPAEGEQE